MLVIKLLGGLGNQMFQYAFGLSLSTQMRRLVKFDAQDLLDRAPSPNFTFRDFELDIFVHDITLSAPAEIRLFTSQPNGWFERLELATRRKLLGVPHYYREKAYFVYDAGVKTCPRNTYFDGYWQNEKYFKDCDELIRQAFVFKKPLIEQNLALAKRIANSNSISVHIRRGDYVTNTMSNQAHGICSLDYYQRAVELVKEKISDPTLFIFSDEPEWVRENLLFDIPSVYINHNLGKQSYEDMRLMSLCKHNIIANSSFSWWGAWLNKNDNKIVVAPQKWMQMEAIDSSDLLPAGWIKL